MLVMYLVCLRKLLQRDGALRIHLDVAHAGKQIFPIGDKASLVPPLPQRTAAYIHVIDIANVMTPDKLVVLLIASRVCGVISRWT